MRALKLFVLGVFLSLGTQHFSIANNIDKPEKTLRTEILNLVQDPQLENGYEETVYVQFMVNKNNEVVVLNVETDDNYLNSFVKNRMNYKTINAQNIEHNELYNIEITFKAI
jgi:hypothetical protein